MTSLKIGQVSDACPCPTTQDGDVVVVCHGANTAGLVNVLVHNDRYVYWQPACPSPAGTPGYSQACEYT